MRTIIYNIIAVMAFGIVGYLLQGCTTTEETKEETFVNKAYAGYVDGCMDTYRIIYMQSYQTTMAPQRFLATANQMCNKLAQERYLEAI